MQFLKENKTLVALALAIVLVVIGAVFKVDVQALLKQVNTVNQEVTTLVADPAPALPVATGVTPVE